MGSFNFESLKKLKKEFGGVLPASKFYTLKEDITEELGGRVLRNVVKRTPERPKNGGTLKRGWKLSKVKSNPKSVTIDVYNAVPYAIYVEKGHRTKNHRGWVEGKFMLEKAENDVKQVMRIVIHNFVLKALKK